MRSDRVDSDHDVVLLLLLQAVLLNLLLLKVLLELLLKQICLQGMVILLEIERVVHVVSEADACCWSRRQKSWRR